MLLVDHVARSFGSVAAVRDVSFALAERSTFGLLGPNGAGKTTTMRMLLGILAPDSGTVRWKGRPIDGAVRRRFGYLPEERGLYGKMKVRNHIAYFGRLHGLRDKDLAVRVEAWIAELGLADYANRPCSELSKGNQQKVQVACAAVHDPELLILDEPFSGLDPVNAEMLLATLRRLHAAGTTLILSSHQMWQLEELCTDFCIIDDGVVRAAGSLERLRADVPTRTLRVEPSSAGLRTLLAGVAGAREHLSPTGELRYEVPSSTDFGDLLRRLVAAENVTAFQRLEPSLNEIYLRAIGNAA